MTLTREQVEGTVARVPVTYAALTAEISPGDQVLLGDGEVELRVEAVAGGEVRTRVVEGGPLKSHQGVFAPNLGRSARAATEKDAADLALGVELGVDYVALSFVRSADDLHDLRALLAGHRASIPVIAKLERAEAIESLDAIIAAADGVMVARGDLGLALPLERVPMMQKRIIREANRHGILVITATQMLESMIENPRPTRAEVSDVANAILDGTDAAMLSGETAVGQYPEAAVRMMARIGGEMDGAAGLRLPVDRIRTSEAEVMSLAASDLASGLRADAIVVFTRSGYSAQLVSNERPPVPVYAFTPDEQVSRRLNAWWGITPLVADWPASSGEMVGVADRELRERGLLRSGQTIVVARWSSAQTSEWSNFVHVHRIGGG